MQDLLSLGHLNQHVTLNHRWTCKALVSNIVRLHVVKTIVIVKWVKLRGLVLSLTNVIEAVNVLVWKPNESWTDVFLRKVFLLIVLKKLRAAVVFIHHVCITSLLDDWRRVTNVGEWV